VPAKTLLKLNDRSDETAKSDLGSVWGHRVKPSTKSEMGKHGGPVSISVGFRTDAAWPHRQSKEPGRFARLVLACPVRQPHRRRSGTILRWIYITIAKLSSSRCSTSIEHPDSSTRVAASIAAFEDTP